MKEKGITLIELIIVISIIGILAVALGFSFQGWMGGYKVESQIKETYVDLMNARARAMHRNRAHFVSLTTTQYTIYEDSNTAPDGNGLLEIALDTQVLQKNLNPNQPITWGDIADTQIEFTKKGFSNDNKTICVFTDFDGDKKSDYNPDYDCIVISSTRTNIGKLKKQNTDGGTCLSANCDVK